MRTLILILAVAAAAPADARAQDPALDRINNLIAGGRFTDADATLRQWESRFGEPGSDASANDRARALYLRALLTSDAKAAEEIFLRIVLSHPSSPVAASSLLRLGQELLAAGEPTRAIAYLERLRSDYYGNPARETGLLWLARAQLQNGAAAAACATAREGAGAVTDVNLKLLLDIERDRACTAPAATQPAPRAAAQPPATQPPRTQATPREPAPTTADFAIQSAAFRELGSARTVAAQLRDAGIDARVVTLADSPLYRVRIGTFATSRDAAAAMAQVRAAGFAAVIVNDVKNERLVRDAPRR